MACEVICGLDQWSVLQPILTIKWIRYESSCGFPSILLIAERLPKYVMRSREGREGEKGVNGWTEDRTTISASSYWSIGLVLWQLFLAWRHGLFINPVGTVLSWLPILSKLRDHKHTYSIPGWSIWRWALRVTGLVRIEDRCLHRISPVYLLLIVKSMEMMNDE